MIRKILIPILALTILGIFACSGDSTKGKANNYDLNFYKKSNGPKPQVGNYVYFLMDIFDDKGKLLQSYRQQTRMPSLKIPPADSPGRKDNPIPEALSQMTVNDSVGILIPKDSIPDLGEGFEDIEFIEYVVVLKEILSEEQYQKDLAEQRAEANARIEVTRARLPQIEDLVATTLIDKKAGTLDLKYTEKGVAYHIHELGTGDTPTKDRMISAMYYGVLESNGNMFDNSFVKGQPYSFRLGRGSVIPGWDDAFLNFPVGTKASIFLPPNMGYGERGSPPSIPGGADLYFYVELESMQY